MLKKIDLATQSLLIVGGLNWLATAAGKFDLVAESTRSRFGRPNLAARTVYGVFGGAALYSLGRLIEQQAFPRRPHGSGGTIREAMTSDPRSVELSTPLAEAAQHLKTEDVGSLPVVENGRLVGILTDRDIAIRVVAEGVDANTMTVGDVASRDLVSVGPEQRLDEALRLMATHQVRRLPVVEDDRLVGILAQADVAQTQAGHATGEVVEAISE